MNGPDKNEDHIFRVTAALFIVAGLLSLAYLLSGHTLGPPDVPTSPVTATYPVARTP